MKKNILVFSFLLIGLALAGCGNKTVVPANTNDNANAGLPAQAGLANPASVKCEQDGYTLQIRTDENGGQVGYCIFKDGSECEEWAYFRGECQPGETPKVLGEEVDESGIVLEVNGGLGEATFIWTAGNKLNVKEGFKVIYSENAKPMFADQAVNDVNYKIVKTMPQGGYVWKNISGGSYYFRVCQLVKGKCGVYSNDVIVNISSRAK